MTASRTVGRPPTDWIPKTDFQRWAKPLLDANAAAGRSPATYQELHRALLQRGFEYGAEYVYKIIRGNPAKMAAAKRPGIEMAIAIGQILGDVQGAMKAADYPLSAEVVASASDSPSAQVTRVISGASLQLLDAFEGIPAELQPSALQIIRTMRATDKKYQERTDIVGKRADSDEYERVSIDEE